MKTVMKKMFCLLLVAVLMVGVMPFQAFAYTATVHVMLDGAEVNSFPAPGDALDAGTLKSQASGMISTTEVTCEGLFGGASEEYTGAITLTGDWDLYARFKTTCANCGEAHVRANCPTYCNTCGGPGHDESVQHCGTCGWGVGHAATCDADCDMGYDCTATNHKSGCKYALCANCEQPDHTGVCCSKCKVTGHADVNHCAQCDSLEHLVSAHCAVCGALNCDGLNHCTVCGQPGHVAALHCTVCAEYGCVAANHCGVCASKNHTTANCPYCAVCYAKGDTNVTSHATAAHCATCDTVNGHKTSCANYSAPVAGSAKLHVWATLHVGKKAIESRLIDTIEGLSPDAKIYQVVSDNRARIVSKFPSGYGIESWTNNLYYMIDADTAHTVNSRLTVGEEDDVVINLYTEQKLVIARVHLVKDYSVDMAVQLNGFRVGDVVTEKDVKNAIKKYYSVSGMKIYTPAEWENVVAGKDANNITNFIVQGGDNDNVYEVYISGARNTYANSTTYKADSTNPKTGDMIFAPVAVLGLSASALAVLFFLNKKRAF